MGKEASPGDDPAVGLSRKRSGVPTTSRSTGGSNNNISNSNSGRAASPVLSDNALGRRLSAAAMAVQQPGSDRQEQKQEHEHEHEQQIGRGPAALGLSEVDLLGQPLIQVTGGISGLGASQLSDNDKFSCIVKYLLNFDRFQEVANASVFAVVCPTVLTPILCPFPVIALTRWWRSCRNTTSTKFSTS